MTCIEDELIAKCGLQHTGNDPTTTTNYRGRADHSKIRKTRVAPNGNIKGPAADKATENAAHIKQLVLKLAKTVAKQVIDSRKRNLSNYDTIKRCNIAKHLVEIIDNHDAQATIAIATRTIEAT